MPRPRRRIPDPGDVLTLNYPIVTRVGRVAPSTPRSIDVTGVRDLVAAPLTRAEILHRPFTRRSRFLVLGIDRETGDPRQFYLGTASDPAYAAPGVLRIALYPSGENRPWRLIGPPVEETPASRRWLARVLTDQSTVVPSTDLELRVLADDLAIRRPPRLRIFAG